LAGIVEQAWAVVKRASGEDGPADARVDVRVEDLLRVAARVDVLLVEDGQRIRSSSNVELRHIQSAFPN
jgi:hypothetical protein